MKKSCYLMKLALNKLPEGRRIRIGREDIEAKRIGLYGLLFNISQTNQKFR